MAEQHSFDSVSSRPILDPITQGSDPVVKGDVPPDPVCEMARTVSASFSERLAPASELARVPRRAKSTAFKPPKEVTSYPAFRGICDDIFNELTKIGAFLNHGEVRDEGAEITVEVEALLEKLYACPYGQGESLKRVVVAVQSQLNNARWNESHVEFLKDVIRYLRVRYLVDDATVDASYDMMRARGLDPFRGTVCEPRVIKRYRIEEVPDHADSSGSVP
jgi:hypothetical protein